MGIDTYSKDVILSPGFGPVETPGCTPEQRLGLRLHAASFLAAMNHALAPVPDQPGTDWQPLVKAMRDAATRLDPEGFRFVVNWLDHLAEAYGDLPAAFHGVFLGKARDHFAASRRSVRAILPLLTDEQRRAWDDLAARLDTATPRQAAA